MPRNAGLENVGKSTRIRVAIATLLFRSPKYGVRNPHVPPLTFCSRAKCRSLRRPGPRRRERPPAIGSGGTAAVAALLGDPARAGMLDALADGRALAAGERAYTARVTPPTASAHLARLVD